MSNDSEKNEASVEAQVFDFYRSLDVSRRQEDEILLSKSIENGLTPVSMRYGVMRDVYRGVVKDLSGDTYYFNMYNDDFRINKADNTTKQWDAERMHKQCLIGVDLVRDGGGNIEKAGAAGGAGQEAGKLPPAPIEEEIDVAAQQSDLLTDRHPGGIGASTPDLEYQGRQWHPDDPAGQQSLAQAQQVQKSWDFKELLSGLGETMQKAQPGIPTSKPHVSSREQQFMVEELGRSPQEVATGNVYMTPVQRKLYNQWLNKGLQTSVNSLESWRRRNG